MTPEDLKKPKRNPGEVLLAHHLIEERKLIGVLSIQLGFPFIEPDILKTNPELFNRGPVVQYLEHNFIPVRLEGRPPDGQEHRILFL